MSLPMVSLEDPIVAPIVSLVVRSLLSTCHAKQTKLNDAASKFCVSIDVYLYVCEEANTQSYTMYFTWLYTFSDNYLRTSGHTPLPPRVLTLCAQYLHSLHSLD